jgi:hypothetical protein
MMGERTADKLGYGSVARRQCDAAGNQQIERAPSGTTTNVWNYENQMILVQMPNGSRVTMQYNANFRRTDKWS